MLWLRCIYNFRKSGELERRSIREAKNNGQGFGKELGRAVRLN